MIDTEVEGSATAVAAAATWLRDTLARKLEAAGDEQQDARNDARGRWEGEAAASYQNLSGDVLRASDKHETRVKRAASALDDYAAELERLESAMRAIRSRASGGGLQVEGTLVHPPADVPSLLFEPWSPEATAYRRAVARIDLWDALVQEAAQAHQDFVDWVDSHLPADVADAREKDASDTLLGAMQELFPSLAAGAGAGLTGLALLDRASDYETQARELRRRSRVAGDPRVRGSADTPAGRARLDDLAGRASWLRRGGRFLGGPGGILVDIGFGIHEGNETGDWDRVVLTTGTSIAVGVGVAALVAAGVVTAPAWAVVLAGGALAAGVSYAVGQVYDHWDDISDWTDDRVDDVQDLASDTWDTVSDTAGDLWEAATPW